MLHYTIIVLIIIIIIYCQVLFYIRNIKKQNELQDIFPKNCGDALITTDVEGIITIDSQVYSNEIFNNITQTINGYLIENKGAVSDFHLIKDVVERNCETVEDEISTLTPIPLYMGLIGTMTGILVGVCFLVFTGGIDSLLSTSAIDSGSGIVELLGGVALAMISSIVGILLTTSGSYRNKNAKSIQNRDKNAFLSWIQIKLLPALTGNTTSAIYTLQQNLGNFNSSFGKNIRDMEGAFATMSQSHQNQLELMQLLDKMDVSKIAKANVLVLKELQNSTQEFDKFNQYLHRVGNYLDQVEKLNSTINEHLNRTQAIEEMGVFFKKEIQQIEQRKGAISQTVGVVDVTMQQAITRLKDSNEKQMNEFVKYSTEQHEKFSQLINRQQEDLSTIMVEQQHKFKNTLDAQQELMKSRLQETTTLIEELKNLSAIRSTMVNVEKATLEQTSKMSNLISAIERLSNSRVEHQTVSNSDISIPNWLKYGAITAFLIIGIAGLMYIIHQIMNYTNNFGA